MPDTELGVKVAYGQVNDFHRCHSCENGYKVNCLARGGDIQCPHCGHVQPRKGGKHGDANG